jgi:Flp pilus assembly protein TadG
MLSFRRKGSRRSGSSLFETAAGLFVLVPVVLFLFDLVSMILVQTANDALAKHAARAAAETPNPDPPTSTPAAQTQATTTATQIVNSFPPSRLAGNPTLLVCNYTDDRVNGISQVYVRTRLSCTLPIPVPFSSISAIDFVAEATEPIVAVLPP